MGESGCGKSTIAGLLTGKNKGYDGSIKVGGKNLNEINETELVKNVTYIATILIYLRVQLRIIF